MDLREEAEKVIAASDMASATMVMIGLPIGTDTSADGDTRSANTVGSCSYCNEPILSTVLKDLILEITKRRPAETRPVLLCGICLQKLQQAHSSGKVDLKGMYQIKPRS